VYKVRDLYPNLGNIRTGEKTLLDADETRMLHGPETGQNGNIWLALAVLTGLVVFIGMVQR